MKVLRRMVTVGNEVNIEFAVTAVGKSRTIMVA